MNNSTIQEKNTRWLQKLGLFIIFIFIVILWLINKKNGVEDFSNLEKKTTIATSSVALFEEYGTDELKRKSELGNFIKNKGFVVVGIESIFNNNLEEEPKNFPRLNCGNSTLEFTYIPDPYRKTADEKVIFADEVYINVINNSNPELNKQIKGFSLMKIIKVTSNNHEYYITKEYSGGNHCCFQQRVIKCEDGKFSIGELVDFGNIESDGNFYSKENELYQVQFDDRFSYFKVSFSDSYPMFFTSFYKYNKNSNQFLDISSELFSDYYKNLYEYQNEWASRLAIYPPDFFNGGEMFWFSLLVLRTQSGYYGMVNKDILKNDFVRDFKYFISADYENKNFSFPMSMNDAENIFEETIVKLIK